MHDIIIISVIFIIAFFQLLIWKQSYSFIKEYGKTFKNTKFITSQNYVSLTSIQAYPDATITELGYKIHSDDIEDEVEITYIDSEESITHPILKRIVFSINKYLLRNKGAVGDFLLIKDIVERNCATRHEEIAVQTPMPLYLGLMGTMLGIIIGIGHIAISDGGFSAFINDPENSIGALMGGVAIAMIASFMGIFLTTIGSWLAKNADAEVEADKNLFYTWLQTELLPTLGGTENSLMTLQQNLLKFNRSFGTNTTKLDKALEKMGTSYESQLILLQTIEQLDIQKMATANVSVLKELQSCTPQIAQFNQYLHQVSDYLTRVDHLNTNINEHLNRTHTIERMGEFFEHEAKALEERKAAINEAVGQIDDRLQKTFTELGEHADANMHKMNETLIKQQSIFNNAINEQQEIFKQKIRETGGIFDELKNLTAVKEAINHQNEKFDLELKSLNTLSETAKEQNHRLAQLTMALSNLKTGGMSEFPTKMKYTLLAFIVLGILFFILQLVLTILSYF